MISKELSILLGKMDSRYKLDEGIKLKKVQPTRIKFRGKFITLKNGKTIWKRPGDAKNALWNDLDKLISYDYRVYNLIDSSNKRKVYEELLSTGLIEFVPVTNEGLEI